MRVINELSGMQHKALRKLQQKKYRYQYQKYFCEGMRCFETAVSCQAPVLEVIAAQNILTSKTGNRISELCKKYHYDLYSLPEHKMAQLSDEKTPAGILFTIAVKENNYDQMFQDTLTSLIYLDRITDPGNLGTLIRTAAWFDVTTVLLSPECVDPYNPKTVRASAGALFSCNLYANISPDKVLTDLKSNGFAIIATCPSKGIPLENWIIGKRTALFFGQEADGLSAKILDNADTVLTVKGSSRVESLNIAISAGIILHFLSMQTHTR